MFYNSQDRELLLGSFWNCPVVLADNDPDVVGFVDVAETRGRTENSLLKPGFYRTVFWKKGSHFNLRTSLTIIPAQKWGRSGLFLSWIETRNGNSPREVSEPSMILIML